MNSPTHFTTACPNCEQPVNCTYYPGVRAQLYGPPERCYPAEPPEVEPRKCPHCDTTLDYDTLCDEGADKARDDYEYAMECRADAARDERLFRP